MSDSLLATKIHVPPLHGNLVNRENLVDRLNEGIARGCRLTLISAPGWLWEKHLTQRVAGPGEYIGCLAIARTR